MIAIKELQTPRVCYEKEAYKQRIHMVGHISKDESIPTHTHHASIISHEFIPRVKPFVTHRAGFASNYVSCQTEMKLTNVREFFVP